jgi:Ca-activated chloride channel family protein
MRLATLLPALFLAAACGPHKPAATLTGNGPMVAVVDPHLIEMTAENTALLVTADTPSELAVRIRVTAGDMPAGGRPPLNLTLLLDTSGSMEGKPIEALRSAARDLVGKMNARDHVSVIAFHSVGEVLVPATALTDDARADIDRRLDGIVARGTTAMADGLVLALQQSSAGHTADSVDRIVLLGDGVPNDATQIPSLIASARAQHVSITSLGLGIEFDPILLGQLATETGGVYRYLEDPEQVAVVFDKELTRMQQVVARNLQLQIRPGPGVTITAIPGLTAQPGGQWAMLGDRAAGEFRDVIVPLQITARRDGAPIELLDATLSFDDAVGGSGIQQRTAYASAPASADADAVEKSVTTEITIALSRAQAAGAILAAIGLARGNDVAGATAILDAAEPVARAVHDAACDELADQMVALRPHLAELVQQIMVEEYGRPESTMSTQVYEAHDAATQAADPGRSR